MSESRTTPPVRVHRLRHGTVLRIGDQYASLARKGRITTGSVWDLLALPLLLRRGGASPRILLLGVGGGSVLPILKALAPGSSLVGVELDRSVIAAARTHFALDEQGIELIEADALEVLRRERRKFDLVIDDVYLHDGERLRKPDFMPDPGLELAAARLRPEGLLVSNVVDEAAAARRTLASYFGGGLDLRLNDCHNHVLVAGDDLPSAASLGKLVEREPLLAELRPKLKIRSFGPS